MDYSVWFRPAGRRLVKFLVGRRQLATGIFWQPVKEDLQHKEIIVFWLLEGTPDYSPLRKPLN